MLVFLWYLILLKAFLGVQVQLPKKIHFQLRLKCLPITLVSQFDITMPLS